MKPSSSRGMIRPVVPGQIAEWRAIRQLYESVFPNWAREPEPMVEARAASGRYRVAGAFDPHGRPTGFSIVDHVVRPDYRVLTFLAVAAAARGRGIARALVNDARGAGPGGRLFVEAEAGPERFYRRLGFQPLAIDYRVPRYDDSAGTVTMSLMVTAGAEIDGRYVRDVVTDMFRDGYAVTPDDPRLVSQLERIPERVGYAV